MQQEIKDKDVEVAKVPVPVETIDPVAFTQHMLKCASQYTKAPRKRHKNSPLRETADIQPDGRWKCKSCQHTYKCIESYRAHVRKGFCRPHRKRGRRLGGTNKNGTKKRPTLEELTRLAVAEALKQTTPVASNV